MAKYNKLELIFSILVIITLIYIVFAIATMNTIIITEDVSTNIYSLKLDSTESFTGWFILGTGYVSGNSELQYIFYIDTVDGKILTTTDAFATTIIESDDAPHLIQTFESYGNQFWNTDFEDIKYHKTCITKSILHVPIGSIRSEFELL
ncbi:hypothetical protein GQ473_02025 [archaeon]|nr:hypothetical protein [archaeon]